MPRIRWRLFFCPNTCILARKVGEGGDNGTYYNLIDCAQKGDTHSLEALLSQFEPLLKKYAHLLGDEDGLPDLQLEFIRATKGIETKKLEDISDASIVNYYQSLIYHEYLRLSKRRSSYERNVFLTEDTDTVLTEPCDSANVQPYADLAFSAQAMTQNLTALEIDVIQEHYLQGYSISEIAEKRQITRQAVNKTKVTALGKLRTNINKL